MIQEGPIQIKTNTTIRIEGQTYGEIDGKKRTNLDGIIKNVLFINLDKGVLSKIKNCKTTKEI
ncbi:hypothetical protein OROMI_008320 [Orobanche minor]